MKTIEREIRADQSLVLLVDQQQGLLGQHGLTGDKKDLAHQVGALCQLADAYRMPVIISTIETGGMLIDEVEKYADQAPRFQRSQTNALEDGPTRAAIEATGRTTLIIAGIVTEIAASMPALTGKAAGYTTALVYDACGGASTRSEHAALERLEQAGVLTISVSQLIGELVTDFQSDAAQMALGLL